MRIRNTTPYIQTVYGDRKCTVYPDASITSEIDRSAATHLYYQVNTWHFINQCLGEAFDEQQEESIPVWVKWLPDGTRAWSER